MKLMQHTLVFSCMARFEKKITSWKRSFKGNAIFETRLRAWLVLLGFGGSVIGMFDFLGRHPYLQCYIWFWASGNMPQSQSWLPLCNCGFRFARLYFDFELCLKLNFEPISGIRMDSRIGFFLKDCIGFWNLYKLIVSCNCCFRS